jgi:hypothetical protein
MKLSDILAERENTHGDYTDHARATQQLLELMMARPGWHKLTYVQRESLHMFAHKIGRILVGDPNVRDHWADIAGYAQLAADRVTAPALESPRADDANQHADFTEEMEK